MCGENSLKCKNKKACAKAFLLFIIFHKTLTIVRCKRLALQKTNLDPSPPLMNTMIMELPPCCVIITIVIISHHILSQQSPSQSNNVKSFVATNIISQFFFTSLFNCNNIVFAASYGYVKILGSFKH